MNKDNVFRSSNFYMSKGDVLHILIQDSGGICIPMELFGESSTIIPEALNNGSLTDFDGNEYTTIIIGNQEWMVENLRVTKYADGSAIPNLPVNADWIAEDGTPGHDGAYCWYNNDISNKADYGAFYNWYACTNAKGLAYFTRNGIQEIGWRVPSQADFMALNTTIGGNGGLLKETGLSHWLTPNTGATNSTLFTGRASGERQTFSTDQLTFGEWWSTDEFLPTTGYAWLLSYNNSFFAFNSNENKYFGFAVRCMRDYEI